MARALVAAALSLGILVGVASAQQPAAPAGPPKIQVLILTGQNGHNWKGTTPLLQEDPRGHREVRSAGLGRGPRRWTRDVRSLRFAWSSTTSSAGGRNFAGAIRRTPRSSTTCAPARASSSITSRWPRSTDGPTTRRSPAATGGRTTAITPRRTTSLSTSKTRSTRLPRDSSWRCRRRTTSCTGICGGSRPAPIHVLATANDDHSLYAASRTDARAPQPLNGPSTDEPMLWTTQFGQGRVFVTVLGHDVEQVQTPTFVTTFARGSEWAATGKAPLHAAASPPGARGAEATGGRSAAAATPRRQGTVPRGTRPGSRARTGHESDRPRESRGRTFRVNMTKGDEVMSGRPISR